MSTVKSLYHIVINTRNRKMTIPEPNKRQLYAYIFGIIKNMHCTLIRMNGIPNHIHLLVDLSAGISLADFMREVKRNSSIWAKSNPELFPNFTGWGKEYYAFSCSVEMINNLVEYIKRQEEHHLSKPFDEEMQEIAAANDSQYHPYE